MKKIYFVMFIAVLLLFSACDEKDELINPSVEYLDIVVDSSNQFFSGYYDEEYVWAIVSNSDGQLISFSELKNNSTTRLDSLGTRPFNLTIVRYKKRHSFTYFYFPEYEIKTYTNIRGGQWYYKADFQEPNEEISLGEAHFIFPDTGSYVIVAPDRYAVDLSENALNNQLGTYELELFKPDEDILVIKETKLEGFEGKIINGYFIQEDVNDKDSVRLDLDAFTVPDMTSILLPNDVNVTLASTSGQYKGTYLNYFYRYYYDITQILEVPDISHLLESNYFRVNLSSSTGSYSFSYPYIPSEIELPNMGVTLETRSMNDITALCTGKVNLYVMEQHAESDSVSLEWIIYGEPKFNKIDFIIPEFPTDIENKANFEIPRVSDLERIIISISQGDATYDNIINPFKDVEKGTFENYYAATYTEYFSREELGL